MVLGQTPVSRAFRADRSDSIPKLASDTLKADSLKKDTVKNSSGLKSPVIYSARDSIRYSVSGKEVFLYGNAEVKYQDINLKADYIRLDQSSFQLYAEGVLDTLGKIQGKPVFKEGDKTYNADYIAYNFKSKKGKIREVRTEEGEGYLHGQDIKKTPTDELFVRHGKYSTCNLEHPHFYINIDKAKVTQKRIITGPAYLVVEDVPLPLAAPFGFFPKKATRTSGIIVPNYFEDPVRGFALNNGGYYFAVSDHLDAQLTGSIFTNGSFLSNNLFRYATRYKYSGDINLSYSLKKQGEPGTESFSAERYFFVKWNHRQEGSASPGSSFSANVNAGSSRFLRDNSYNVNSINKNDLNSSINYNKQFLGTPFSLSIAANHNQNVQTRRLDLDLPAMSFNVSRITPFAPKIAEGRAAWYQKLGFNYTTNLQNSISATDTSLFRRESLKDFRTGISHTIPINTSITVLKYLIVSPGINYSDKWVFSTIRQYRDGNAIKEDTVYGFKAIHEYNANLAMSTRFFGMFTINKLGIVAIRHVGNPFLSYNYTPDLSAERYGYYKTIQDSTGKTLRYSIIKNSIFSSPSTSTQSNLGFGLGNNLEMKVKSKKDTLTGTKKIVLFQNLAISSQYNLAADSFQLSNINVVGRTMLLKNLGLDFGANFDPYVYSRDSSRRVNQWEYTANRRLARLTSARLAINGTLNPSKNVKKSTGNIADEQELAYINNNLDNYVDFTIPWNLNISYSLVFSPDIRPGENRFTESLIFNGDVKVTDKWKIGFNSGYDPQLKRFTTTQLNIYRDLHCWDLSFNWIPFGTYQSYNINLKVKARILQDLKLTRKQGYLTN